jgi:hypothetical protein
MVAEPGVKSKLFGSSAYSKCLMGFRAPALNDMKSLVHMKCLISVDCCS